jgi:hypothetical protein
LQAVEAARGSQERQHAVEDPHVLRLASIHAHADVAAAIETDLVPAARHVEHHLHQLSQDAGLCGTRNHAHVEYSVRR